MQLQSTTGPYLLIASGAALLLAALISFKLPMILFAAILVGLGFWALRDLDLSRFMTGPLLLWAIAAVIAVGAVASFRLPMLIPALAFAGLGYWARRREKPGT